MTAMDKEKPKGISKSTVDAFGPQEKAALLWDTKIAGFGLRVMPSGVKSYIFQYRIGGRGAPSRRYTIGRHGSLTPDQARKIASDLAAKVAAGIDPLEADRAALKAKADQKAREAAEARKLEELAFSAYVEHFLTHGLKTALRERTRQGYEIALRRHAVPVLGDTPLPEIGAKDVQRVLDSIPASQPSVRRIVFAVLRLLFKFAASPKRADISASPLAGVEAPEAPKHRKRVLKEEELRLALRAIEATPAPFGPLFALLFATGQRREEVAGLKWSELDRKTETWTLPADRAKNDKEHIVPLNRRAIAALDQIAGQEGEARPKWPSKGIVFVSSNDTSVSG